MFLTILKKISAEINPESIITLLLENRGLTPAEQTEFLEPPSPEEFRLKDLKITEEEIIKALLRIKQAQENHESVVVYGDYDTDGICASAIIWESCHRTGKMKIMPYLPVRQDEGYGFSDLGLEKVIDRYHPNLIISVDHGINEEKTIKDLKEKGIEVLVLDHHLQTKPLKSAVAVLHSTAVCAAGLSYFLAKENFSLNSEQLLNYQILAGLATITDILPLKGISRSLASSAIANLNKTSTIGLKMLLKKAGLAEKSEFTSYDFGFILGPRLNAAGRVADPVNALRLLCTKNAQTAEELSDLLNRQNLERQNKLKEQLVLAEELLQGNSDLIKIVASKKFEEGIVGLLAGKLSEKYYCPVLAGVISSELIKGSARSIKNINLVDLFGQAKELLQTYGGHSRAAGFSLQKNNLAVFSTKLNKLAKNFPEKIFQKELIVDLETSLQNANLLTAKAIKKLEPFGEGNPEPLFYSKDVQVVSAKTVGKTNAHLQLLLKDDSLLFPVKGVYFNGAGKLTSQKKVNLVYSLGIDTYFREQPSLQIKEIFSYRQ